MQNRVTYEFAIIRLVPKVEREEFINIGVILFSKRKKYLDIKYTIDEKKITALSADIDIKLINQYLEAWSAICQGSPRGGTIGMQIQSFRFRWIVAPKNTIIQCSRAHPGLCEDPQKALEDIFDRYVL